MEEKLNQFKNSLTKYFETFSKTTADSFAWLSILVILMATIPSFLAAMSGLTEKMPPLDIVLLTWVGLLLYFVKSAIIKDMLMVVTIGFGFAVQAILLGFIFFT